MNFKNSEWEDIFENKISQIATADDPAHDLLHFKRVVQTAKKLCHIENGIFEVVIPAAWLHDMVIVAKDHPLRKKASSLSAEAAINFLETIHYPSVYFENIAHAITAHSFSANIMATTLEAKIVQDADRLDGLGAIGVARCFAVSGLLKRPFYHPQDPFCEQRPPNDADYTIDHFYQKLFKISETLNTKSAKDEGQKRINFMKNFLSLLKQEII